MNYFVKRMLNDYDQRLFEFMSLIPDYGDQMQMLSSKKDLDLRKLNRIISTDDVVIAAGPTKYKKVLDIRATKKKVFILRAQDVHEALPILIANYDRVFRIIASSKQLKRTLIRNHFNSEQIFVLPGGQSEYNPFILHNQFNLLAVITSRIAAEQAIKVIEMLRLLGLPVTLDLYWDGNPATEDVDIIQQLIQRYHFEKSIRLIVGNDEASARPSNETMQNYSMILLTEQTLLSEEMITKSQVNGVVPVSFNSQTAHKLIKHGQTGILVQDGDLFGMSMAIANLLNNQTLFTIIVKFLKKGYKRPTTMNKKMEAWIEFFDDLHSSQSL
ncbi:MAG: hypothetical protein LBT37_00205 [Lactobacillaceae bacterium]|jgi:hypothetical protein|nr:hypothetical protein [Lactobacillaceae bacterium]